MNVNRGFVTCVGLLAFSLLAGIGGAASPSPDVIERGHRLTIEKGCQGCHTPKIFTENGPMLDSTRAFSGQPQDDHDLPPFDAEHLEEGWFSFNKHQTCWVGPWGVTYSRNLTPDPETGIGNWTEAMFVQTLRAGAHTPTGTLVYPMPWVEMARMPNADLAAIFAYLQTVPPVKNRVPAPMGKDQLLKTK